NLYLPTCLRHLLWSTGILSSFRHPLLLLCTYISDLSHSPLPTQSLNPPRQDVISLPESLLQLLHLSSGQIRFRPLKSPHTEYRHSVQRSPQTHSEVAIRLHLFYRLLEPVRR